jgi:nucleotide-binding universal stress UspA family protein
VDAADEVGAAVIVLGSSERRGVAKLVERSVSHEVAQHAKRPLLIVPQRAPGRVREGLILIGYDGSEHVRRAIEAAHALVRARDAIVLGASSSSARAA